MKDKFTLVNDKGVNSGLENSNQAITLAQSNQFYNTWWILVCKKRWIKTYHKIKSYHQRKGPFLRGKNRFIHVKQYLR